MEPDRPRELVRPGDLAADDPGHPGLGVGDPALAPQDRSDHPLGLSLGFRYEPGYCQEQQEALQF